MAYKPKQVELTRSGWGPDIPDSRLDYARQQQTDRTENDLDSAVLRNVARNHSPSVRPEVRGAQDTYGWDRYGGPDGDGPDRLVVGRAADSQNRRQR